MLRPVGAYVDAPYRAHFILYRLRGARQGRSIVNAPAPRTHFDRPTRPPWRDVRQPTSCRLCCSFDRQFYAVPVRFVAPLRGVCGCALTGAILFYFAYLARCPCPPHPWLRGHSHSQFSQRFTLPPAPVVTRIVDCLWIRPKTPAPRTRGYALCAYPGLYSCTLSACD